MALEDDDNEDFIENLERIRQSAPLIRGLQLEMAALFSRAHGTDATGSVHVTLAADGMPEAITVDEDWRRLVGVDGLAQAVTEAWQTAALTSVESLDSPAAQSLSPHVDAILAYLGGDGPPPPGMRVGSPPPTTDDDDGESVGQQWPSDVLDEVNRVIDRLGSEGADHTRKGSGAHGRLTLAVTATEGVVCEVDAEWLHRQDTQSLNEALASAVLSLRGEWDAVNSTLASGVSAVSSLLANGHGDPPRHGAPDRD